MMKNSILPLIAVLSLSACAGDAVTAVRAPASVKSAVLHVDADAAPGGDGSGDAPYSSVELAVAHAADLGGATILVRPGTYSVSKTIEVNFPLALRGSNRMGVDSRGWPTGVIEPGSETRILGTAALGSASMIAVGQVEAALYGVTIENLTIDLGPGTGIGLDLIRTQHFLVRGNRVKGSAASAGIQTVGSSGRVVGNYVTGVGCGTCIGAGNAASPAHVEYVGNRATGNRFGGVLLFGAGVGLAPDAEPLEVEIRGNDLSYNTFSPRFSFGVRVFVIRRDFPKVGDTESFGSVIARIQGNRIVGNEIGISVDAGFAYRRYLPTPTSPATCDTRVHRGYLDISLRGNEISGSLLTPAIISFTRNTAALNTATLANWQYLQLATYSIHDPEESLAGYWLDHPKTDRFIGGICAADGTSEVLGNTLLYNGAEVGTGFTVPQP